MAAFNFLVDPGPDNPNRPRVNNIKFGDGYEQRTSYGINTNPQKWNLGFANRDEDEGKAILAFLKARGGVEAFDWIPPLEVDPIKVKCQEWTKVVGKANLISITATFEEVFDP